MSKEITWLRLSRSCRLLNDSMALLHAMHDGALMNGTGAQKIIKSNARSILASGFLIKAGYARLVKTPTCNQLMILPPGKLAAKELLAA